MATTPTQQAAQIQCIWDGQNTLGEGIIWSSQQQCLYWVDIEQHQLHRLDPTTRQHQSWAQSPYISAIFELPLDEQKDTLLATFADGIKLIRADRSNEFLIDPEPQLPNNRINDATISPDGCLWFGTMAIDGQSQSGRFYRLDSQGVVHAQEETYGITNGPAFCPRTRCAYFVDSSRKRIFYAQINENGERQALKLWLDLAEHPGTPDGIIVDADAHVWVAFWGGACVARFDPQGRLERQIDFPQALNITKCAIGGPKMSTLYAVSARAGMSPEELKRYPLSGGVFSLELPDVTGQALPPLKLPTHWLD